MYQNAVVIGIKAAKYNFLLDRVMTESFQMLQINTMHSYCYVVFCIFVSRVYYLLQTNTKHSYNYDISCFLFFLLFVVKILLLLGPFCWFAPGHELEKSGNKNRIPFDLLVYWVLSSSYSSSLLGKSMKDPEMNTESLLTLHNAFKFFVFSSLVKNHFSSDCF